jgi:hypothetical protein
MIIMAIELKRAEKIAKELKELFRSNDVKIEIRGSENEVVVTGKSATLHSNQWKDLSIITNGHSSSLGRSGANFRLIIW